MAGTLKFDSAYLRKVNNRLEWLSSNKKSGFKLEVDSVGFDWINALEFGTRQSKGPYIIAPRSTSTKLIFIENGVLHFEGQVVHPGIHPHRFIVQSLPEIRKLYKNKALEVVVNNPEQFNSFLKTVGEDCKIIIRDNLALVTKTPVEKAEQRQFGNRFPNQAGRLGGRTASQEFDRIVKVVVL